MPSKTSCYSSTEIVTLSEKGRRNKPVIKSGKIVASILPFPGKSESRERGKSSTFAERP